MARVGNIAHLSASANLLLAAQAAAKAAPRLVTGDEAEAVRKQRLEKAAEVRPAMTQETVDRVRHPVVAAANAALAAGRSPREALEAGKAAIGGRQRHGVTYTPHQGNKEVARRLKRLTREGAVK